MSVPRVFTALAAAIYVALSVSTAGQELGQDTYITSALREIDPHIESDWLEPQATRVLKMSGGVSTGATLVRVDPRVVAVVFEDGTSAGDPAIVDDIFDLRRAQRDTYAAMLTLLRSALADVSRPLDVPTLVQAVTSHRHARSDAGVVETLLQNLTNLQKRIGNRLADPRIELQHLERMMTLEHAAAVKHAEPVNVRESPRK